MLLWILFGYLGLYCISFTPLQPIQLAGPVVENPALRTATRAPGHSLCRRGEKASLQLERRGLSLNLSRRKRTGLTAQTHLVLLSFSQSERVSQMRVAIIILELM